MSVMCVTDGHTVETAAVRRVKNAFPPIQVYLQNQITHEKFYCNKQHRLRNDTVNSDKGHLQENM